jgi:hypothetical protein
MGKPKENTQASSERKHWNEKEMVSKKRFKEMG